MAIVQDVRECKDCVYADTLSGSVCVVCPPAHRIVDSPQPWYLIEPEPDNPTSPTIVIMQRDGMLFATPQHHPAPEYDSPQMIANLKSALLRWVEDNTNWAISGADSLRAATFARYGLFFARVDERPPHPGVWINISEDYAPLPRKISDEMTHATQRMIGYFDAQHRDVRSGQMAPLKADVFGRVYDPSVATGAADSWREPFEAPDDCKFCAATTDERIRERIDGMQWAMDKELAVTVPYTVPQDVDLLSYPHDYSTPANWPERQAFRARQVAWEREHPNALHAYYLHDLPWHLQRTLVTQWNHIWRDWLAEDPAYDWHDGALRLLHNSKIGTGKKFDFPARVQTTRIYAYEDLPGIEEKIGVSYKREDDYPEATLEEASSDRQTVLARALPDLLPLMLTLELGDFRIERNDD